VAPPRPALHFSDALLKALADRGVELTRITCNVGLGTFRRRRRRTSRPWSFTVKWVEGEPRCREAVGRLPAAGTAAG